jgi:hypothetical protein
VVEGQVGGVDGGDQDAATAPSPPRRRFASPTPTVARTATGRSSIARAPRYRAHLDAGDHAPADVRERLEIVLEEHFRILVDWEPQLRASLRVSLEPGAPEPPLRGGRAIEWIEEALRPLGRPASRQLAIAIRAAAGIEPYVWLTDIAGLSQRQALATMRTTALTILDAANPS